MLKRVGFTAASIICAGALAAIGATSAAAAKKVSYEDAWAKCKVEIGANVPGSDATASASRSAAGGHA